MRRTALAPEVLRARRLVRAVVIVDLASAVVGLAWVLYVSEITLLMYALVLTVPLLVCDAGAWRLDLADLRRRSIVGAGVLVAGLWVYNRQKWGPYIVFHEKTSGISRPLLAFSVLCGLSVPVFLYAWRVAVRHRVEHHHPAHVGGGGGVGKAGIESASAPAASGSPTGWGRQR